MHWRGGKSDGSEVGPWRRRAGELAGQNPYTGRIRIVAHLRGHDGELAPRAEREWERRRIIGFDLAMSGQGIPVLITHDSIELRSEICRIVGSC